MSSSSSSQPIAPSPRPPCLLAVALVAAFVSSSALPAQTAAPAAGAGAELSRTVTTTDDGRELILIRSLPPARRTVAPVAAPLPAPAATTAQLAEEARQAAKRHESFTVSAVVYAGSPALTELRWTAAGREWLAYSNVDFHALTQLSSIETDDAVYQWFPFVSDGNASERPRPPGLAFAGPEAEYVVYARQADWSAAPEAFVVLDWLHAHYQENRLALDSALALRRAEAARRAAEPPPPPKPVIVRYYQPVFPPAPAALPAQGGAK